MLSTVLRSEAAIRVSIRIAEHSRLWIIFRTLTKEVFVLAWRKANMKTEFNLILIVKLVISLYLCTANLQSWMKLIMKHFVFALAMLQALCLCAQTTGVVVDENKQPLPADAISCRRKSSLPEVP